MIANEIIKAALLGTEKYMPTPHPAIKEISAKITGQSKDKEDRFLKQAAVTLFYKEAGSVATEVLENNSLCPDEVLEVLPEFHNLLLKTALTSKDEVLFHYLIFVCNTKNKVVDPAIIPLLLNKALEHKKSSQPLLKACGQTGKWLCSLNKEWAGLDDNSTQEEVWETGNIESRKSYLSTLRSTDPTAAIILLENSLQSENAANRQAFIELLQIGLSINDEPFLVNQLDDKSQKVKDTISSLLKDIQGSQLNQSYLEQVLKTVSVKEERYLLVSKKKVLIIDENIQPEEPLLKTGIQKISSEKDTKDSIFILGQLLACIDPSVLAKKLHVTDKELIILFLQYKECKTLLPFLNHAAITFKNKEWARSLLDFGYTDDIHILDTLNESEQKKYYDLFLGKNVHTLLSYVLNHNYQEIDLPFAQSLLEHLRLNPYTITQPYYQTLALHLPATIIPKLTDYSLDNNELYQAKYFRNQIFEILRILEIKQQLQ